jgi:hypothetical protein
MPEPIVLDVDVAPEHLLRWLRTEMHVRHEMPLVVRATRTWSVEAATGGADGVDPEDELAVHVAYGTLEVAPPDRCWSLTVDVVDAINGGMADDWPPVGIEADGPDEVNLDTFADTFPVEDLEARVTLTAQTPEARRKAERVITLVLKDAHARSPKGLGLRGAGS